MSKSADLEFLENNSIFFSRIGFENDPARYDEEGKLILFGTDHKRYAAYHAQMHNAGIKVHSSILFSGWVGPDRYDYTLTDEALETLFAALPEDALYIPRVKLNAPVEWSKVHPEELFVYYGSNPDPEWIRPRVGTLEHDILGYEAPNGYYMGIDRRPNLNGAFSNASFASVCWREDAARALRALLQHFRTKPYGNRIIGIHVAYGVSGETCMWGRFGREYGDYSYVFRNAFLNWGKARYGSEEALKQAWGTLEMPSPAQRKNVTQSVEAFKRQRPCDVIVKDLDRFTSELNSSLAEYFCRIVKEFDPALFTGIFYGYTLDCYNAAYTGWLGLDHILNSPWIDFMAAPCSYARRTAGESGGFLAPAQSIRKKKLWMDELDIRTYLAEGNAGSWLIPKECTEAVFFRELTRNLSVNTSFWWMDLGGGWFDSDYVRERIRKTEIAASRIREMKHKSVADVLMLVDENSFIEHSECASLSEMYLHYRREAALAGITIDLFRVADLKDLDLTQYKLIILCDCSAELPSFPEDKTVLYCYLDTLPEGLSYTGCPGKNFAGREVVYPEGLFQGQAPIEIKGEYVMPRVLPVVQEGMKIHGRFSDGSACIVSRGKHYYSVLPCWKYPQFHALAQEAGCLIGGKVPCTVYGDNRFTAVFPALEKKSYSLTIHDH